MAEKMHKVKIWSQRSVDGKGWHVRIKDNEGYDASLKMKETFRTVAEMVAIHRFLETRDTIDAADS